MTAMCLKRTTITDVLNIGQIISPLLNNTLVQCRQQANVFQMSVRKRKKNAAITFPVLNIRKMFCFLLVFSLRHLYVALYCLRVKMNTS